jgi:hypothetical protein
MAAATKTSADAESRDLKAIAGDIAELKRELAGLASRIADDLSDEGERAAEALGRQVEEQPVLSLLLAFAAGFIASRILSR